MNEDSPSALRRFRGMANSYWPNPYSTGWGQPHQAWVYRFYDAEGALLYVGCTENLMSRLRHHERLYGPLTQRLEVVAFDTRAEAEAEELEAIETELPLHNVAKGTGRFPK